MSLSPDSLGLLFDQSGVTGTESNSFEIVPRTNEGEADRYQSPLATSSHAYL